MFSEESQKTFVQLSSHIEASGWQVYYNRPYSSVVSYVHGITQTIYAFGWIIMIFLGIMVLLLSTFYRTALNRGRDLTDALFPNFILQPLVENALDHGLKNSLRFDKQLRLSIRKEAGLTPASPFCISISIYDNGCGMDAETVKALFQIQTSGYGIKNVNDRLRLLYGDAYVLSIISKPGEGTLVTLKVPPGESPASA